MGQGLTQACLNTWPAPLPSVQGQARPLTLFKLGNLFFGQLVLGHGGQALWASIFFRALPAAALGLVGPGHWLSNAIRTKLLGRTLRAHGGAAAWQCKADDNSRLVPCVSCLSCRSSQIPAITQLWPLEVPQWRGPLFQTCIQLWALLLITCSYEVKFKFKVTESSQELWEVTRSRLFVDRRQDG
jgi:hypothetical protein